MEPQQVRPELAEAFARDGVVCVRGVLDADELANAARAIEAVLARPGPLAQVASSRDDPGSFTEDFCRWREVPQIEQLARHSRLPELAAGLMATPQVRFYHDHILVKEGGTTQRTPWHQDQPYYNVDGPGVSAWIPVDPVPAAGGLELLAASHRGPWLMPRTFLKAEARWFPEGSLAELPDIEADRGAFDIRSFDLEPGDVIFFDFLTVHGAPGFPFSGRRRVLSLRYLSADARHARRNWRTSPPFDGLDTQIADGSVLDHPLFPVVWSAAGAPEARVGSVKPIARGPGPAARAPAAALATTRQLACPSDHPRSGQGGLVGLMDDWTRVLEAEAASYARVALTNIKREFPSWVSHTMKAPGDFPYRPRARTPVFYGSFDWHSCVEMHWLLVRLLRVAGDAVPADEIRAALGVHFERVALAAEEEFISSPDGRIERPYGWGWALALIHETATWDDPYGRKWASAMTPLGDKLGALFLDWLSTATYPVRHGVHSNSAFGLSRALPQATARARSGEPALLEAIIAKAHEWFGSDMFYPGGWEPSGHDFLSPALTEAELMAQVLDRDEFAEWLGVFLPGIERGEPASLFSPAVVSDSSDGQVAHLHGLNASRAWCWRRLAESLPEGDPRTGSALAAARVHARAALPHVVGDDYNVEHWLAAYAVLMLS